ncbi:MAG: OadG family protein [Eubacteriales bacterium]|nr:OadG family protein [Eubacteriales bacterium]
MQNNVLLEGLSTTVTGILVVYLGLIILIGAISLMRVFSVKDKKEDKPSQSAAKAPAATPAPPAVNVDKGISPDIVACIAAAVASIMQGESPKTDFIVRSIRRR